MALKQTRRTVSFAAVIHAAITKEAERRGLSAPHFVETLVRKAARGLPPTEHVSAKRSRIARNALRKQLKREPPTSKEVDALAERVAAVLARKAGKRVRMPKRAKTPTLAIVVPVPPERVPIAASITGADPIDRALEDSGGSRPVGGADPNDRERNKRKRSVKVAKKLRERGLLTPENEGYASPDSWSAAK